MAMASARKVIRVDVTSDTICPWCFVGKKHLEQAVAAVKDRYDVQVAWHPFFLNPDAPLEGVNKMEHYKAKFGDGPRMQMILDRVSGAFAALGYKYSMGGLTGSTLDSHRLLWLAGKQSLQKQNALVEELFLDFFTREKYIGDRQVLLAAAEKVGVQDGEALLAGETGLKEVLAEERSFRRGVSGVPHFVIDGRYQVSGAQPPEAFVEALELAAKNQKPEANGAPTAACTRDGCQ